MECGDKRSERIPEKIDPEMAKELLQSGYRYLDVRTVDEYRKGNVKDSINIPYWFFNSKGKEVNPQFMELVLKSFSKDDYIVVACASGTRSAGASLDLVNAVDGCEVHNAWHPTWALEICSTVDECFKVVSSNYHHTTEHMLPTT